MMLGFIAGREIRSALDGLFSKRSSGIGPGARGWHSNGILGPVAAACSVSKILDLEHRADAGSNRISNGILRGVDP